MKWADSGYTSLATSTLAQHSGSWTSRMKVSAEDPTSALGFSLWATPNLDLRTETPSSRWWSTCGEAHEVKHILHPSDFNPALWCELPSAKGGQLEAHFKVHFKSEIISSKDFCYVNISILMYPKYFQFKMVGIKLIWSLSATIVTYLNMLIFITTAVFLLCTQNHPGPPMSMQTCLSMNRSAIRHIQAFTTPYLLTPTHLCKCGLLHR